jgi:hypothetical protein
MCKRYCNCTLSNNGVKSAKRCTPCPLTYAFGAHVIGSAAVAAVRLAGRHCSHCGTTGGKLRPLRAAPADGGTVPDLRRSPVAAPRHRSLPPGIRHRDLVGRPRDIGVVARTAAEVAADYRPAGDERIPLRRASIVSSGKSTISSFWNLVRQHWMHSKCATNAKNTGLGAPPTSEHSRGV